MSGRSKLLFSPNEVVSAEKMIRISNAQSNAYIYAITAPGRTWRLSGSGGSVFKDWKMMVMPVRSPYVAFRFRADPISGSGFLAGHFQIWENGAQVSSDNPIVNAYGFDYAHIRKVPDTIVSNPVYILRIFADGYDVDVKDLQIMGCVESALPMRVIDYPINLEVLTTS